jgi:Zn finger protein HypA/HybF involved in hydrogenase expression
MNETRRKFSCSKCGLEPEEWERTPEKDLSDYECPRCGKSHFHFQTETADELIPVDEKDRQVQNIFITPTGRKVRGKDAVLRLLNGADNQKFCKRCGNRKDDNWVYRTNGDYDIICPECEQRHLEDIKRLIPVDEAGNRLNVVTDREGNTYVGEQEIQEGLKQMRGS